MERHLIIHGHFYQPPRKNPWTGIIEKQPDAAPADNWNQRILNECYMPNARVSMENDEVNNYRLISHNIGPTLSNWMAENYIDLYKKIVDADRAAGGAMALPYNHTILPLDNDFIRKLQISWGIDHFELNYARKPEGMWLPECAVSYSVIEEIVRAGIKFILLTPGQAEAVKRINGYHWYDVSEGNIDVRRPYRIFCDSGHLDVFFSHHELAVDMSFRKILDDPRAAAEKIEKMFGRKHTEDLVLTVLTDGETFGHHHKFADRGLAELLKKEIPRRGIKVTNPASYLKEKEPQWEVRIKNNSSWSCPHGVQRWRDDCGCGAEEGSDLKWRKPLRDAIDWLGEKVIEIFTEKASGYFTVSIEEAASAFGRIISNPSKRFDLCSRFVKDEFKNSQIIKKSIELIHFTCYMFTSCGWFFGSLKRVEPVQNLSAALRAVEILRELWEIDLEADFYRRLDAHRDVEDVWNREVKSKKKEPRLLAEEFLNIYLFTGINRIHLGYWYMEVKETDGVKKVVMEHTRTGEFLEFKL